NKGYPYTGPRGRTFYDPILIPELPQGNGPMVLSFLDLIEVQVVNAFLKSGVRWRELRLIAAWAMNRFETPHPFSTQEFLTDGRNLFLKEAAISGNQILTRLSDNQLSFNAILMPFVHQLQFSRQKPCANNKPVKWLPLGQEGQVALDPARKFGQPILDLEGIPTIALFDPFNAGRESIKEIAQWYEIPENAVAKAIEFEQALLAA
ncbi:MAG: hypothetical protein ACREJ2_19145, partial [Planctomycetota bacterium]